MIKDILQEAFLLKEKGYYKYAVESFYKALSEDNTSVEILFEIAECYYFMQEEGRALDYLDKILDLVPTHISSMKLLKQIFINKEAWNEAEQTAKNIYCISQDKEDLADILNLLNKKGCYNEIFEYQIEDETSSILYEKAKAKYFLNELSEAEKYINKSLDKGSDNKKLLLKGKILYKNNKKEECSELFENINPEDSDSEILNLMGLIKQYECDFKSALNCFLKAVKAEASKSEYYYNCASTYFKMGDIQQAKKYYNLAISLEPQNQNYHFALANLYYSEKNYKRAMEELDYDFFEAKLLKSVILYDSGYLAIARKELEELSKEQPDNELVINYRNRIEEELRV